MQEYKGRGSKVPAYLGFRPADGLSVESRMVYGVSYFLGRTCLDKVYETQGFERFRDQLCTPAGSKSIRIAVSKATGRSMLDPILYNYKL